MKNIFALLAILVFTFACSDTPDARTLIDKTITAHGGNNYNNFIMKFDFRGSYFELKKEDRRFKYQKIYRDSSGNEIREVIDNKGIHKFVNGEKVKISENEKAGIDNQVNSVAYFTLLPEPLNDKAVVPRYIGETEIDGKKYYELEVTFRKEGGGRDHRDRYIYWINKDNYEIDYFTYFFYVNDGGHRFRKLFNKRNYNGIIVSDQLNYTSDKIGKNVEDYDEVYNNGNIKEVSKVLLENVDVELLK